MGQMVQTPLSKTESLSYLATGFLFPVNPRALGVQASMDLFVIMPLVIEILEASNIPLRVMALRLEETVKALITPEEKKRTLVSHCMFFAQLKDAMMFFYQTYADHFFDARVDRRCQSTEESQLTEKGREIAKSIAQNILILKQLALNALIPQVAKDNPRFTESQILAKTETIIDQIFKTPIGHSNVSATINATHPISTQEEETFNAATCKGLRGYQEDRYVASPTYPAIYAVLDGHGGSAASQFLKDWISDRLKVSYTDFLTHHPTPSQEELSHFFTETIKSAEIEFNQIQQTTGYQGGSTLSILVQTPGHQWAHIQIGDSCSLLIETKQGAETTPTRLSLLDTPTNPREVERIESAGGRIEYEIGAVTDHKFTTRLTISGRVFGEGVTSNLNMTASFGDEPIFRKPAAITFWPATLGDIIVISSDGLHDVILEKEIHAISKMVPHKDLPKALIIEALKRGSGDNITVVVVSTPTESAPCEMSSHVTPAEESP
jgi:serine/threonine protein phosphatase PrpC